MTPLSILLILTSALIHSSWKLFAKRGNWPMEFFFWVFLWNVFFYLPFFIRIGAFRQAGVLFGAGTGIALLKESHWKTRITGALILTSGLVLIGLAK